MIPTLVKPSALVLARRAADMNFFHAAGTLPASEDVASVATWALAIDLLTGDDWLTYLTEANNEIVSQLVLQWRDQELSLWDQVAGQINEIIYSPINKKIRSKLPTEVVNPDAVVNIVLLMINCACIERHYFENVSKSHLYDLFQWLEMGHLPCGATADYPSRLLYVF